MARGPLDTADPDALADLPALDGDEEGECPTAVDAVDLSLPETDGAPDDEAPAADLGPSPLADDGDGEEPSALADDATGSEDTRSFLGLTLPERVDSLVGPDTELGTGDDAALGVEALPEAPERTDRDGLDDPDGLAIDVAELPRLDEGEEDGASVDLGIELPAPEAEPAEESSSLPEPPSARSAHADRADAPTP